MSGGGDTPDETQGYYAVNFGYNVIGYLKNSIYEMSRYADGYSYATDLNGVIISQKVVNPSDPSYNSFVQAIKDKFLQNNIVVNEIVGKVESYTVGEQIPNWNEYIKI